MITKEEIYKLLEYKYDCSFDVFIEYVTTLQSHYNEKVSPSDIVRLLKEISEESDQFTLKSIQLSNRMICCIIKNEKLKC